MSTSERAIERQELPGKVIALAAIAYVVVLLLFWLVSRRLGFETRIRGHQPSAFISFALLLAPYWFFGFGLAPRLHRVLKTRATRSVAPTMLLLPYLVFSLPRGEFKPEYALAFATIAIGTAALFEYLPPRDHALSWQDVVALAATGIPVQFGLLRGAWPHPGLGSMPKLLVMDAVLYAYLVCRVLPGVGYELRPKFRDAVVGFREFLFFAPIAISLGIAIGFNAFHASAPEAVAVLAAWMITFFFIAIPEELFFRGLLQNLLETRLQSRGWALVIASGVFGLSHFNKPLPFNWRYVLLATVAGLFYGRAWRDRKRLFSSAITHTNVDVVWSFWFLK